MCGITGLISRDGRPDEMRVRRMNQAVAHRGVGVLAVHTDPDVLSPTATMSGLLG